MVQLTDPRFTRERADELSALWFDYRDRQRAAERKRVRDEEIHRFFVGVLVGVALMGAVYLSLLS